MYQKDIEVLAKKSNLSEDQIEKAFENIKCIFEEIANQFKNIINRPGMQLAFKVAMDKELNHYARMHRRVKSKRLKKKYEKKFDRRLNEMKLNLNLL